MASYDYKDAECYVLDAGDYTISLRKNSHELCGAEEDCTFVYTQEEKVVYDSSNPRRSEVEAQKGDAVNYSQEYKDALTVNAATNKFTEMNEHFVEYAQATAARRPTSRVQTSALPIPPNPRAATSSRPSR